MEHELNGSSKHVHGGVYMRPRTIFFSVGFVAVSVFLVALVVYLSVDPSKHACKWQFGGTSADLDGAAWQEMLNHCTNMLTRNSYCMRTSCEVPTRKTITPESSGAPSSTADVIMPTAPPPREMGLPTNLEPMHYTLKLKPFFFTERPVDFHYEGTVDASFLCTNETDTIVMNKGGRVALNNYSIDLMPLHGNRAPRIKSYDYDRRNQFITFYLDAKLEKNQRYTISMSFGGSIYGSSLYISRYAQGTETKYFISNNFGSSYARRTFPCFDEPQFRTSFDIILERRTGFETLSMMGSPNVEVSSGGFEVASYRTSPPMQLRSVAILFMNFSYEELSTNLTRNNIKIRLYAQPDCLNAFKYLLAVFERVVQYGENLFDMEYPTGKLDLIIGPRKMDRWSATQFDLKEDGINYHVVNTMNNIMSAVQNTIHQWFGHMTSPQTSTELWISDYLVYDCMEQLEPNWKMTEDFVYRLLSYALRDDGYVANLASSLARGYRSRLLKRYKAATLFRMVEGMLGKDAFRRGLHTFLVSHKNKKPFVHDELWDAFEEATDERGHRYNIKEVMTPWITQNNYPLVTILREGQPSQTINVTQHRYIQDRLVVDDTELLAEHRWTIPITFVSSIVQVGLTDEFPLFMMTATQVWLTLIHNLYQVQVPVSRSKVVKARNCDVNNPDSWILGNPQVYNYYRVNYEEKNWKALAKQLKTNHSMIHPFNRAQLLSDAWTFISAELLNVTIALDLMDYLEAEDTYVVWRIVRDEIEYMTAMLSNTHLKGAFQTFFREKLQAALARVGIDFVLDQHYNRLVRHYLFEIGLELEEPLFQDLAIEKVNAWMEDTKNISNTIDEEVRIAFFCTAVRHDTTGKIWSFFYEMWSNTTDYSYYYVLACSQDQYIKRRYMQQCLDDKDWSCWSNLNSVMQYESGNSIAWDFYKQHQDNDYMSVSLYGLARLFNTERELEELRAHLDEQGWTPDRQAFLLELVKMNIRWMDRNLNDIEQWFIEHNYHF